MQGIVVVGIHTGIGKTIASAVLCEALQADYWKPVQAGSLDETDSHVVKKLVVNKKSVIHKEAFCLTEPMSPHAAARIDGVTIEIEKIKIPATSNKLIIETAGGLMSPLNDTQTNLDLIRHLKLPAIVVSMNYLGSINHTLLTLEMLNANRIIVHGILFNGEANAETEKYILNYTGLPSLGRIDHYKEFNNELVLNEAKRLKDKLAAVFNA